MTKGNEDNNKERKRGDVEYTPEITKDYLHYITPGSSCSPIHCVPLVIMFMYLK